MRNTNFSMNKSILIYLPIDAVTHKIKSKWNESKTRSDVHADCVMGICGINYGLKIAEDNSNSFSVMAKRRRSSGYKKKPEESVVTLKTIIST